MQYKSEANKTFGTYTRYGEMSFFLFFLELLDEQIRCGC
jgi:hypothetical protein